MPEVDYTSLGKTPISSDEPVGIDVKYEPDFEWIQEETDKLSKPVLVQPESEDEKLEPGQPRFRYEPVDWDRLIEVCCSILEKKSKDLRVASWLAVGLMERDGIAGLTNGLDVFLQIIEEYWDKLHPVRQAGRAATILHMRDTVRKRLEGSGSARPLTATAEDAESLEKSARIVGKMNDLLKERMADSPISLNLLESIIEDKLATARSLAEASAKASEQPENPQAAPAQQPFQQPPAQSPASPSATQAEATTATEGKTTPSAGYDFSKPADRSRYFDDVQQSANRLHSAGIDRSPGDPVPYRWVRIAYWLPLAFTADRTEIPMQGPNETLRDSLKNLWETGQWGELLKASERQFPSFWFWLDLQRYSVEALENMGDIYATARSAIETEITFLLRRMPFFINMSSQDGVPVATPETKDWLKDIISQRVEGETASTDVITSISPRQQESESFAPDSAGSVTANLEKAREHLQSARREKDRFVTQLVLAEYLLNRKEIVLAYNYLEQLDNLIQRHGLERWDPDLAVQALGLLHAASLRMIKVRKDDKEELLDKSREIVTRIAALDPVAAAAVARNSS